MHKVSLPCALQDLGAAEALELVLVQAVGFRASASRTGMAPSTPQPVRGAHSDKPGKLNAWLPQGLRGGSAVTTAAHALSGASNSIPGWGTLQDAHLTPIPSGPYSPIPSIWAELGRGDAGVHRGIVRQ